MKKNISRIHCGAAFESRQRIVCANYTRSTFSSLRQDVSAWSACAPADYQREYSTHGSMRLSIIMWPASSSQSTCQFHCGTWFPVLPTASGGSTRQLCTQSSWLKLCLPSYSSELSSSHPLHLTLPRRQPWLITHRHASFRKLHGGAFCLGGGCLQLLPLLGRTVQRIHWSVHDWSLWRG